jgi:hypothetical protein
MNVTLQGRVCIQEGLKDTEFGSCICEENKMTGKYFSNMNSICVDKIF